MIFPLFEAWIPKNCWPDCEFSPSDLVSRSKARAVKAFFWAISMLPIRSGYFGPLQEGSGLVRRTRTQLSVAGY